MLSIKITLQKLLNFVAWITLGGLFFATVEQILFQICHTCLSLTTLEAYHYVLFSITSSVVVCFLFYSLCTMFIFFVQLAASQYTVHKRNLLISLIVGIVACPLISFILWMLTQGRRVRDIPGRFFVVLSVAFCISIVISLLTNRFINLLRFGRKRGLTFSIFGTSSLAIVCLVVDVYVLPHLYHIFHWTVIGLAVVLVSCSITVLRALSFQIFYFRMIVGIIGLVIISAFPASCYFITYRAQVSLAIQQSAPLSGKVLAIVNRMALRHRLSNYVLSDSSYDEKITLDQSPLKQKRGIDIRGNDVLLITIDALRADRLSAYGGNGLVPNIDKLSDESVVFLNAYTPTPHTSYALASMLTGKFLKPVMEIAKENVSHPTLTSLLKRNGYQTAAFFPEAVFYLDQQELKVYQQNGYDFEYTNVMFTTAHERVQQIKEYLDKKKNRRPHFIWAHFFEPHEPYEPPERFITGSSPIELYNAEVASVDDAVGILINYFCSNRSLPTVILTSDHGEAFGEHGTYYHGTTLYEEQVKVPFIWFTPSIVKPRKVEIPVETVDIATTLLSVLGIPRDARMQGDDLGSVLLGYDPAENYFAFSEIGHQRMISDGHYKAICNIGNKHCLIYDLFADPFEQRVLDTDHKEIAARLLSGLGKYISTITKLEKVNTKVNEGHAEILSRARLGDPLVGSALVPLLGEKNSHIRAVAARYLGEFGYLSATPIISRLRLEDPDRRVRQESAIAALCLGDESSLNQVKSLLKETSGNDDLLTFGLKRRASLCLADLGFSDGWLELISWAQDDTADVKMRLKAIRALGKLEQRRVVEKLIELLKNDYLRIEVTKALAAIGGRRSVNALLKTLRSEPYLAAQKAEAEALIQLGDKRVLSLIKKSLNSDSPIPDSIDMLINMGELDTPSSLGAQLNKSPGVLSGDWKCTRDGCQPLKEAKIKLPFRKVSRQKVRVIFHLMVESRLEKIQVNSQMSLLQVGKQDVNFVLTHSQLREGMSISSSPGVWIIAVVVASALG